MWTVCRSNNSFHVIDSGLQRKSFRNITSALSTSNQEYLLSALLEKVLNIFCSGAKMKVFAQSAGPTMNMFLCFPLPLTKRSRIRLLRIRLHASRYFEALPMRILTIYRHSLPHIQLLPLLHVLCSFVGCCDEL